MPKSKRIQKSKKAAAVTRFTANVEVQQSHYIDLDIQPVGHDGQPPEDLASAIIAEHGQNCVEYSGSESGETEWEGKRYSFSLTSDLCDSDVSIDDWASIEQVEIGGAQ